MTAITVNFDSIAEIGDEQFYRLCIDNPDTKFERNAQGEIIIMSPQHVRADRRKTTGDAVASRGGETGKRNTDLIVQIGIWNGQTKLGEVFDSSTGYKLPNGANRYGSRNPLESPDVSWIASDRWHSLTSEQKQKFIPLAPDFVIELTSVPQRLPPQSLAKQDDGAKHRSFYGARECASLSPSDYLVNTQAKLQEYLDNGVKLGWLINPEAKQVEIYRPGRDVKLLNSPRSISGEAVLPGFVLDLTNIF